MSRPDDRNSEKRNEMLRTSDLVIVLVWSLRGLLQAALLAYTTSSISLLTA